MTPKEKALVRIEAPLARKWLGELESRIEARERIDLDYFPKKFNAKIVEIQERLDKLENEWSRFKTNALDEETQEYIEQDSSGDLGT